jgi:mRNA interferase RelE/StbE
MAWTLQFTPDSIKDLRKLDRAAAIRILSTLEKRIAAAADPRLLGAPLRGDRQGNWRWRIGDYRVLGRLDDVRKVIVVAAVGHRREVYR